MHSNASDVSATTLPSSKLDAIESKLQLLLDLSLPNTDAQSLSQQQDTADGTKTLSKPWNELFGRITDMNKSVDTIKQSVTCGSYSGQSFDNQLKQKQSTSANDLDADITKSVVIYGLPETKECHDTALIETITRDLECSVTVSKFRRLRSKKQTSYSGPPPLLLILANEFDQRKLLANAPLLRRHAKFNKVFIKQALSTEAQHAVTELRRQCKQINEDNFNIDPSCSSKLSVFDGKVRLSHRQQDDTWKVDWKCVIDDTNLSVYLLKNMVADGHDQVSHQTFNN